MEDWLRDKLERFVGALPTVVFFIVAFCCIAWLFDPMYTMVVSSYTALFNMRCKKYNAPSRYLHIVLISLALLVLARLAVINLALCIALNLVVPCALVFMRSSQLNPRRYFPYAMLFVFLELRPENFSTPPAQLVAVLICCALTIAGLALMGFVRKEADKSAAKLHANIRCLADVLDTLAERGPDERTRDELIAIKNEFSAFAYTAREDEQAPDTISDLFDMFAALAHRTAYLAGSLDWQAETKAEEEAHVACMRALAELTRDVDRTLGTKGTPALIARARELRDTQQPSEHRLRIFFRSYLSMLVLILEDARNPDEAPWNLSTANQLRIAAFRKRPSLDSFELRFSVRCGTVLAVTCAASMLFPLDHLYWFTLHAFLLMQPYRAESLRRMRTRAIGTVLGCVLVHALSLLNLPYEGVMALGMVFIACLYTARPGSVSMAFFATSYAVSLASFSIGDDYATVMRIACLALAIALVFCVNRLVVPTSERRLFQANIRLMFSLYERYWELVRKSLTRRMEATVPVEALLHFQMVHLQALEYVDGIRDGRERDAAHRVLFHMWELACELEQLELLVRLGEIEGAERDRLDRFAQAAEEQCAPFTFDERMMALRAEASRFERQDVRYVLNQYLLQAKRLAAALDAAPGIMLDKPAYLDEVKAQEQ